VIVLLVGCSGGNNSVITPSGVNYVFVDDPPSGFHIFEVIGTTVSQLTSGSGDQRDPSVSWDRTKCAFTQIDPGGSSRIAVVALPGGSPVILTDGPNDFDPAISPDGSSIVFCRGASGSAKLWMMLSDGKAPKPIGSATGNQIEPEFSADGRAVYYASNVTGNYDIYRVDTLSGGVTQITSDPTDERHPTLFGAYEDLIYSSNATGSWRLYFKDATLPGSAGLKITNGPGDDVEPCWPHPENMELLFTNINGTTYTIKRLEVFPLLSHTPVVQLTRDVPQQPSQ
jgi:Tol biopolymer transport system component